MEDKNIFPRLSRKMFESLSSFFFSCFVLVFLVVLSL